MARRPGNRLVPSRRLILLALASLPVLALLLTLGTWQLRRLQWKTDLLAAIAAAEAGPPQPLGPAPAPYSKVVATGRFDHAREALLSVEVRGAILGSRLLVPLLRADAPPLLVDRGWVPLERTATLDRPTGEVAVIGYVRPADPREWVSATDDVPGRRFYVFDPLVIGAALDLPGTLPFGLVALAPPGQPVGNSPGTLPAAARSLPRSTNPHLGYAITWYGLAGALVGVAVVFARRRPTQPLPGDPAP